MDEILSVSGFFIAIIIYIEYSYRKHIKELEGKIQYIYPLAYRLRDNIHDLCHVYTYKKEIAEIEKSLPLEELKKIEKELLYHSLGISIALLSSIRDNSTDLALSKNQNVMIETYMELTKYKVSSSYAMDSHNLIIETMEKVFQRSQYKK